MHWIDLDWKMRVLLLDIVPLHDSHTGTLIATTIAEVLRRFGLGERVLGVTTDNGSNMVSMAEKLSMQCANEFKNHDVTHLRCAAHVLNLAVKEGLSVISTSVKKARLFVNHLRHSPLLLDEMKDIALALKIKFLMPERDVQTRWNST